MLTKGKLLPPVAGPALRACGLGRAAWLLGATSMYVALLYCSPPARAGAQELSVDEWTAEHFTQAREAQARNELDAAAEGYRAIISRNPKFAGALLNLGIVYHQQRKYRESIQVLQRAVSLDERLLGAQLFLGIDQYLVDDPRAALPHLGKALELKPDDRQAGIYLALAYVALDEPEKAAQQLRKTAQHSPDDPEIFYEEGRAYLSGMSLGLSLLRQEGSDSALYHWALAMAAEQKSDLVTAVQEYLKALARDPGIAELYVRLGVSFQKAGMPDLAAACLERLKMLNPQHGPAHMDSHLVADRGSPATPDIVANRETFRRLWQAVPPAPKIAGLPAVADEAVNRAVKQQISAGKDDGLRAAVELYLSGDYASTAAKLRAKVDGSRDKGDEWLSPYLLARCYLLMEDDNSAQGVLDTRLTPYLDLPPVALLRVEIESRMALRCFDWVAAHQPNSYFAKALMAESYAAAGQDKEALAAYHEILKLGPNRLGIHLAIGRIYEKQLQWAPAIEEYRSELALDSANAMALAHLGHVYTQAREPERAIQVLERLLKTNPSDGQGYADLGKAWALKGDTAKAIAAYEQALRYTPDEYDLHYRLYSLYAKSGDNATAQRHLAAFKVGESRKKTSYQKSMAELEREGKQGTN